MRTAGVIGWPIAHSKSPVIHRFWLRVLGIDGDYSRFAVRPDELGAAVRALPALGIAGVNVTVPHKVAVLDWLDDVSPEAAAIGAVAGDAEAVGDLLGVRPGAGGHDELAAGQPLESRAQPCIDGEPVERDVVDVDQKILGLDTVVPHQSGHRRAMVVKIFFLHPPRLDRVAAQQPHDERPHARVDQVEQLRRRRIERVVEIEDPVLDMVDRRGHDARAHRARTARRQGARFCPSTPSMG